MGMIKKIYKSVKTPKTLIRKLLNRLPQGFIKNTFIPFPKEEEIIKELEDIFQKGSAKIFIFPLPTCPWGYMFQRPQQIARALAEKGYTVLYLVDTNFPFSPDWDVRGVKQIEPNLYLYNDNASGRLLSQIKSKKDVVIWQFWPHQRKFVKNIEMHLSAPVTKIYDCIDHLSTFLSYERINEDFNISVKEADIVIATAKSIYKELIDIRKDTLLIQNGVRIEDFISFEERCWAQLEQLKTDTNIIAGYYGAIADWFDFSTVEFLARKNKDWTFLFVGEIYPEVEDKVNELKRYNNVKFLPRVSYADIPQLLAAFDVALLPFLINDITVNTSPVKVYEYMAGRKLIVSSDLPEVRNLSPIFVARNHEEFHVKLHEAFQQKDNKLMQQQLLELAGENTWSKRIEAVLSPLEKGCGLVETNANSDL
ncbi:glycosyltransferase [Brevibacillus migulae]|uniref:glycosyltransferase n=1 Tax=Brevibacillus migulae TaxID=1644114 RepID=UPI00106F01B7|nr:glycosyltransferase [Brevibacillus migulae]